MIVNKTNNTNFQGKNFSRKTEVINIPTQKYNHYIEKRVERIISTAKEQLETNPKNEMELIAMIDKVGLSNVLEYFKRH